MNEDADRAVLVLMPECDIFLFVKREISGLSVKMSCACMSRKLYRNGFFCQNAVYLWVS